jgi:hypothetical protein
MFSFRNRYILQLSCGFLVASSRAHLSLLHFSGLLEKREDTTDWSWHFGFDTGRELRDIDWIYIHMRALGFHLAAVAVHRFRHAGGAGTCSVGSYEATRALIHKVLDR